MNVAVRAVLLVWLAGVNVVTFILYGVDKSRAKKGRWRCIWQPDKRIGTGTLCGSRPVFLL